ncbi:MAG TPA: tRNA adenosine(34) deaminase TadA [Tissierellales bacterium]|nr:tRNA adenosine(34) deaminase TadA [Tissierellales bacterium]
MNEKYMRLALLEAYKASKIFEVPVGAIIVQNGRVVGSGYNKRETLKDPTAHAEIIAIRNASQNLKGWRLLNSTMYVTIEPCAMCAGAILNSRIERLVIGARDYKMGCCGTVINLLNNPNFNHQVEIEWGILEEECSQIMKDFFKELRKK